VQFVSVGSTRQKFSFNHEVVWVVESETTVVFKHGGKVVRTGSVFNDYYGFLSSFGARPIQEVEAVARDFSVDAQSSMEIQLVTKLCKNPYIEREEDQATNAQAGGETKQYSLIPTDWCIEISDDQSGESLYPALEMMLVSEQVLWSSKNTPEQNSDVANAFRLAWGQASTA
jgi:hypothetical protein